MDARPSVRIAPRFPSPSTSHPPNDQTAVAPVPARFDLRRDPRIGTSGYNYLIQLIPIVVVAPLFIQGRVEFGVIGQSAMAFATLLGAFSLVITQFQAISSYAAVATRLCEFVEYAERCDRERSQG